MTNTCELSQHDKLILIVALQRACKAFQEDADSVIFSTDNREADHLRRIAQDMFGLTGAFHDVDKPVPSWRDIRDYQAVVTPQSSAEWSDICWMVPVGSEA